AIPAAALAYLVWQRRAVEDLRSLFERNGGKTRKMLAGVGIIFVFEKAVGRALQRRGSKLPPSLISMIAAFILLKVYEKAKGKEKADRLAGFFSPAVDHLGKWMPLYLTPPLVVLPDALATVKAGGGDGVEGECRMWAKLGGIHCGGWLFTLLTTAAMARWIQQRAARTAAAAAAAAKDGALTAASSSSSSAVAATAGAGEGAATAGAGEVAATAVTAAACCVSGREVAVRMRQAWAVLTAASYLALPVAGSKPATFSTTVLALLYGNALPPTAKKVLHPLVVCSLATGVIAAALGRLEGRATSEALSAYFSKRGMLRGGAGDLFFGLLGSSCCALGFRMFANRRSLQENLLPLAASTAVSSMLSLFGTAAAAGAAGLPPIVALTLAQRSVMSSLGIPAAQLLGGDAALAVASILVTGVYGASVGQAVLDGIGCCTDEPVVRGIATGASAHSIGTASLMESEPEAAAIASVALCLAGVFHTAVCSVPVAQSTLKRL
ncbi:unnamed protein product, partial [Phaeothamnion confervicola]